MSSFWAEPQNMVVAAGPGGVVVDIREPDQYERWHAFGGLARDGLRCLDCDEPANPRRYHRGTPRQFDILVHSPQKDGLNPEERCAAKRQTGRGAGWKRVLKEVLAEHLRALGCDVMIDPAHTDVRVDIAATTPTRRMLIRVELSKLDYKQALETQLVLQRLRDQERRTDVLWITFGCAWVDKLPAVGIRFVEGQVKGAVDMGGVWAVVDAGYLTGHDGRAPVQPTDSQLGLGTFLRWYVSGAVQNYQYDTKHRGWAGHAVWSAHLASLVRTRDQAEQRAHDRERDLKESLDTAAAASLRHAAWASRAAAELTAVSASLNTANSSLAAVRASRSKIERDREAAVQENARARAWIAEVEGLRASSRRARRLLRNVAVLE